MKKILFVVLILISIFLIGGCSQTEPKQTEPKKCPSSCDDRNPCTTDLCSAETNFDCIHNLITNCCGNEICESEEKYSNCSQDCDVSKEECEEFEVTNKSYIFKYHLPECKNYQILKCKTMFDEPEKDSWQYRHICFLNMAIKYQDGNLCQYVFEKNYDMYWYCMGLLRYGESACGYIKSSYWLEQCLKNTR